MNEDLQIMEIDWENVEKAAGYRPIGGVALPYA